jgi:NifU-like protein
MNPAELYDDHRTRPRNIGKLLNANATGDVGSIVVGDALRFYLKIEDERITAARFQVFNAQDQVASTSALTELVVGKSLDEAVALSSLAVAEHLGGLDPYRLPARLWGLEGLKQAIATYRGEDVIADETKDALVCRCHGITEETVRQSVIVMNLQTVDDVVAATGAGTGCGSCRVDIQRLIEEAQGKAKASAAAPATPERKATAGRMGLINRINAAVGEAVRRVTDQGGELELMDLVGNRVVVRISGLNDDAARAALGALEATLKEKVDPGLGVELSA